MNLSPGEAAASDPYTRTGTFTGCRTVAAGTQRVRAPSKDEERLTMPIAATVVRTTAWPVLSLPTSDAELAERAAGGDDRAFEAIMRRHNRLLFRTARSILRSDAESEDAVQEVYLGAWRALAGPRADSKLSTLLVRIVINETLGRLSRRSATVIPLEATMDGSDAASEDSIAGDAEQQPDRIAMRGEIRRLMEARIDTLPEAFRTVFML